MVQAQAANTSLQKSIRLTLSMPMQAMLFVVLSGLILWTLYFSTYPATHNAMHKIRHATAAVACH